MTAAVLPVGLLLLAVFGGALVLTCEMRLRQWEEILYPPPPRLLAWTCVGWVTLLSPLAVLVLWLGGVL